MWQGVPFACQRRPIIGVLRMCWLLPGSFDCFCCPPSNSKQLGFTHPPDSNLLAPLPPLGIQVVKPPPPLSCVQSSLRPPACALLNSRGGGGIVACGATKMESEDDAW